METILLVVHVLIALALIGLVLLQQGKGADAGAAFGSGASATVFGARGSGSFLTRTTAILAAIFFVTSLSLAYFSGQNVSRKSVTEIMQGQESSQPAQPGTDVPSPETQPAKPDVPQPVR